MRKRAFGIIRNRALGHVEVARIDEIIRELSQVTGAVMASSFGHGL